MPALYARGMDLVVRPPLAPMLARLERTLPIGEHWAYEPKWDGFRCLVFVCDGRVELRSRNQRPLQRYFPEIVEAVAALPEKRFVIDGEIIVETDAGFDFSALLQRLHPARSRVERLRIETPASFVAFDALCIGEHDLQAVAFGKRREALAGLLRGCSPPLFLTPSTTEAEAARAWLSHNSLSGIDGVMAKDLRSKYEAGRRSMTKVKLERTADCVVAGFRWHRDEPTVGSLLLGLYDGDQLRHVGLATGFDKALRRKLLGDIAPFVRPIEGHPWETGFAIEAGPLGRLPGIASSWAEGRDLTWIPLEPALVCEVAYEHFTGGRFRHPGRFRHWRPDRDARSCTSETLSGAVMEVSSEHA